MRISFCFTTSAYDFVKLLKYFMLVLFKNALNLLQNFFRAATNTNSVKNYFKNLSSILLLVARIL